MAWILGTLTIGCQRVDRATANDAAASPAPSSASPASPPASPPGGPVVTTSPTPRAPRPITSGASGASGAGCRSDAECTSPQQCVFETSGCAEGGHCTSGGLGPRECYIAIAMCACKDHRTFYGAGGCAGKAPEPWELYACPCTADADCGGGQRCVPVGGRPHRPDASKECRAPNDLR